MFSVKKGNAMQLIVLVYFIVGNITLGTILDVFNINLTLIPNILISQLGFVALSIVLYLYLTKSPVRLTLNIKALAIKDVFICIGIAWTIMPLLSMLNVISQFFVTNQIQGAIVQTLNYPLLLVLILTAVSPAIFEELLTRSLIISNYRYQPVLITCLISGLFFGFIHLNINQFVYAFVMGAIMCYIVMITESIISSMIIHFTINATGVITLYMANLFVKAFSNNTDLLGDIMSTASPSNTELLLSLASIFFVALFLTPIAVLLIGQLLKNHNKSFRGSLKLPTEVLMNLNKDQVEAPDFKADMDIALNEPRVMDSVPEKILTPPLIGAIVIFILFAISLEFFK